MDLKDYLYTKHITFSEFSKRLGIDLSVFSRCINGKMPFSERVARQIEIYTEGNVKKADLIKKVKK